ncbi:beta-hexosaminidase 2 [Tripterygium wilfordii]|uniref:beta-N-acetylhexosaminidase n=1 Tax=Tripterygium wilfordii TaxID=458696 RepID=A0A7J7E2C6_TRIWF|nr:beta-hexosaminidase 2 [Tripterygium wilfordii]
MFGPKPRHCLGPNQKTLLSPKAQTALSPDSPPVLKPNSPLPSIAMTAHPQRATQPDYAPSLYTLSIPSNEAKATLTAETALGAMRGLETFSQLVWGNSSIVPVGLYVTDSPLFGHRGIMLDTSRIHCGGEDILRTIGAMSANKLNVFHWHITDCHSFPLVVPSDPNLAAKDSHEPNLAG